MSRVAAPLVRTVLGDIDPLDVGFCSSHDHVLIGDGLGTRANPDLLIADIDEAATEVTSYREAGGRTLVDAMPLDCGRDPVGLAEVSRRTGVHIVATTGFHTPHYYEATHWSTSVPVATIADLLVAEVLDGLDRYSYGGPVVERIAARAGLCKVASERDRIGPVTRRLVEAVAQCHARTGVPVLTHMEGGTMGLQQVELLTALGVPADAILLSHVDRNHDRGYHAELAASGAYLVYDGPSRTKYHPPELVAELVAIACDVGAGKQVLLGMDLALRSYRTSCGGSPGLAFLPSTFVQVLRDQGHTDEAVDRFTVANPAQALSMRSDA